MKQQRNEQKLHHVVLCQGGNSFLSEVSSVQAIETN